MLTSKELNYKIKKTTFINIYTHTFVKCQLKHQYALIFLRMYEKMNIFVF